MALLADIIDFIASPFVLLTVFIAVVLFVHLFAYSLCRIAKESDERMESENDRTKGL